MGSFDESSLTAMIPSALPHRPPFLLIDRVSSLEVWSTCVAYNQISKTDPVFDGHFPGNPIYPGVLVLESLAQAAAFLLQVSDQSFGKRLGMLSGIDKARLLKPVLPGSLLRCEVTLTKKKPPFYFSDCQAFVGDTLVATSRISAHYC